MVCGLLRRFTPRNDEGGVSGCLWIAFVRNDSALTPSLRDFAEVVAIHKPPLFYSFTKK